MWQRFEGAAAAPLRFLVGWKERTGRKIIGTFPMYVPEEVAHAAGFLSVCVPGSDDPVTAADEVLHSAMCHPVRASLDLLLRNKLDFLDGMILSDVCDQAKRNADVWPISRSSPFFFLLRLPRKLNSPASHSWLCHELARLCHALEHFSGRELSDDRLKESINLFNRQRSLLEQLYQMRTENPSAFGAEEVETVVAAAMVMPKEEHVELLSQYLHEKRQQGLTPENDSKVRLVIWGNPCEDLEPGLARALAAIGALVVDDSLHCGRGYFSYQVPLDRSPIEGLAEAFFRRSPCPAIYGSQIDSAQDLVALARKARAQGVILLIPKFCEIYSFDYPYLAERLKQEGLPQLLIETDHSGVGARIKTRLEAFVEAIRAG